MKIGCGVWTFTRPKYNAPYEEAIKTIGGLGFDGVELIIFSEEDLDNYYTPERIQALVALIRDCGLELSEVAVYDGVVHSLNSLDSAKKNKALELFKRSTGVAAELGAGIVNMVSQWPEGMQGPAAYPPHTVYAEVRGAQYYQPKNNMSLPKEFNWSAVWENYTDSIRQACQIAAASGLRLALEGHTHVIVPNTDSMLRLIDWVDEDNLGVNLDTGWHFIQREYIPLSVLKLGSRIFHVHTRDGDGILSYGLPPGSGIIDWAHTIECLQTVGYNGFLSFEMTRYEDPAKYTRIGLRYLRELLGNLRGD